MSKDKDLKSSRFQPGFSGNPGGRPRGSKNREAPYETILGQNVDITDEGVQKRVTAAEAFILYLVKSGLEGNSSAARIARTGLAEAERFQLRYGNRELEPTYLTFHSPGSVNWALEPLRMAKKLDRYRPTARMALEPWIVEMALKRLKGPHLSSEEQKTIVDATRTPKKVRWPDWWEITP